jgi:hypothetical protein
MASHRPGLAEQLRARLTPPSPEDFSSPLHDERVVARIGVWLGACMAICFLTGIVSHYQQHPASWLPLGPDPAWGYRFTQGAHVLSGTLMLPLLLAKLFSAYPRLFTWPPVRGVVQAVDRISVAVLIGSTVFQIATGLMNAAQWYAWPFGFVALHFTAAWLAIGALLVHVAIKLPVIQRALGRPLADHADHPVSHPLHDTPDDAEPPLQFGVDPDGRSRRGFLIGVAAATAGAGLLTAGQTVWPLRGLAVLAPRRPGTGPQGLPVNRSATEAGVTTIALDPAWRLELIGPAGTTTISRDELLSMTQHEEALPIACVEGWSAQARWQGVRIRELVSLVGGGRGSNVQVVSMEVKGYYARTLLPAAYADHPRTLLALGLNGSPLHLEHGYPARLIAPNRPGVLQTKWVTRLTVEARS